MSDDSISGERPTILLVDDDGEFLRGIRRLLTAEGYDVTTASDGRSGLELARGGGFDLVLSDLRMPGLDGLQLLREVRRYDADVPVILMTGSPNLESAIQALEHGAIRYLVKPVDPAELRQEVRRAVQLHRLARLKRRALELLDAPARALGDRADIERRFERALGSLWVAFQPIVSWSKRTVIAYEALVRTDEPELRNPAELFDAAERLGRSVDLGRVIRDSVADTLTAWLAEHPGDAPTAFVNLSPHDLLDDALYSANAPLSRHASRVVFEITERAALERIEGLSRRIGDLRKLGFRVAVDDLGAGYAGLSSFALLEPDVVKIDMSLVRRVQGSPTAQRLVAAMAGVCRDLSIQLVAEGVETAHERDTLVELGIDLLQGHLFTRPGRAFPVATI